MWSHIWFAIEYINQLSISHGYQDIELQRFWGHDLDLLASHWSRDHSTCNTWFAIGSWHWEWAWLLGLSPVTDVSYPSCWNRFIAKQHRFSSRANSPSPHTLAWSGEFIIHSIHHRTLWRVGRAIMPKISLGGSQCNWLYKIGAYVWYIVSFPLMPSLPESPSPPKSRRVSGERWKFSQWLCTESSL